VIHYFSLNFKLLCYSFFPTDSLQFNVAVLCITHMKKDSTMDSTSVPLSTCILIMHSTVDGYNQYIVCKGDREHEVYHNYWWRVSIALTLPNSDLQFSTTVGTCYH